MRGFKLFGSCLAMAALLAVAVLPAGAASAAKALVLEQGGVPVAAGSPGDTGLALAGCVIFSEGTVKNNEAAKDILTAATNAFVECEEGISESGTITETQLGSTGKATLKGTIEITQPGPCKYKFTKFKGTFAVPGSVFLSAPTVGKLNKTGSLKTCEKTLHQEFFADATPEALGEAFEDIAK